MDTLNSYFGYTIHNLRGKIEPDPAKPVYLCNVWGKGYVFRPEGKQE